MTPRTSINQDAERLDISPGSFSRYASGGTTDSGTLISYGQQTAGPRLEGSMDNFRRVLEGMGQTVATDATRESMRDQLTKQRVSRLAQTENRQYENAQGRLERRNALIGLSGGNSYRPVNRAQQINEALSPGSSITATTQHQDKLLGAADEQGNFPNANVVLRTLGVNNPTVSSQRMGRAFFDLAESGSTDPEDFQTLKDFTQTRAKNDESFRNWNSYNTNTQMEFLTHLVRQGKINGPQDIQRYLDDWADAAKNPDSRGSDKFGIPIAMVKKGYELPASDGTFDSKKPRGYAMTREEYEASKANAGTGRSNGHHLTPRTP